MFYLELLLFFAPIPSVYTIILLEIGKGDPACASRYTEGLQSAHIDTIKVLQLTSMSLSHW